jgi:hypothetical protein
MTLHNIHESEIKSHNDGGLPVGNQEIHVKYGEAVY